jgi:hypothetical protein
LEGNFKLYLTEEEWGEDMDCIHLVRIGTDGRLFEQNEPVDSIKCGVFLG